MKKIFIVILLLFFILGCSKTPVTSVYQVKRVVDGDTFVINMNGKSEHVRLIGVDTPETVKPNTPVQRYGKEASNFTKKLISNKDIKLEFDVQQRDKYGRLLAYVYLDDGRMLNEILLQEGYARLMTVPPNVKYVDSFKELEKQARYAKKGLWSK